MASKKQKHKQSKKPRASGSLHPDGDRRRRGWISVDQAIANMREMQQVWVPLEPNADPKPRD